MFLKKSLIVFLKLVLHVVLCFSLKAGAKVVAFTIRTKLILLFFLL